MSADFYLLRDGNCAALLNSNAKTHDAVVRNATDAEVGAWTRRTQLGWTKEPIRTGAPGSGCGTCSGRGGPVPIVSWLGREHLGIPWLLRISIRWPFEYWTKPHDTDAQSKSGCVRRFDGRSMPGAVAPGGERSDGDGDPETDVAVEVTGRRHKLAKEHTHVRR